MQNWRVLAASEPGSSHLNRGVPCQDAHAYRVLSNGTLLIAVADGAGSVSRSGEGAQIAVSESIVFLTKEFSDSNTFPRSVSEVTSSLKNAASIAREAVHRRCREIVEAEPEASLQPSDFASTLILVAISDRITAVLQIGDGAAVIQDSEQTLDVLTTSGHEEYLNETTFLTSESAIESSTIKIIGNDRPSCGVAVMTDGMQLLAVDHATNSAYKPFFEPLFRFAHKVDADSESLASFLRSDRVCERTDDDKTLVIAVPVTS
jgi:hypothetical protein